MPDDFAGGLDPPDGSAWEVDGEYYTQNPALTLPPWYMDTIRLWKLCQGGMGGYTGAWPDPGGIFDQAAIMIEAFGIMAAKEGEIRTARQQRRHAAWSNGSGSNFFGVET